MSGMRTDRALAAAAVVLLIAGCAGVEDHANAQPPGEIEHLRITVVGEEPHDPAAFTQGFEIDGGNLFETTGLEDRSQLRELDPATGALRRAVPLPDGYFGEGMTVVGDSIWQITYRDGVAIQWDTATFTPRREVPIAGEGWGVCNDGARIIYSDGTNRLRFYDPADFTESGSVVVTRSDNASVEGLNELECVDGQVWANVWPTDEIVRIDPRSGAVTATVDGSVLRHGQPRQNVLNGIAHVEGNEFLLTGKLWPTTYRVRFDGGA
jgi:glutamine cyclotransferase